MESEHSFEPGEIVYLLAEIGVGERIHEIGTRATVHTVTAAGLTVELGGSSGPVACASTHVERAIGRRTRIRTRAQRPVGALLRSATT
jgi:hypothetical protein